MRFGLTCNPTFSHVIARLVQWLFRSKFASFTLVVRAPHGTDTGSSFSTPVHRGAGPDLPNIPPPPREKNWPPLLDPQMHKKWHCSQWLQPRGLYPVPGSLVVAAGRNKVPCVASCVSTKLLGFDLIVFECKWRQWQDSFWDVLPSATSSVLRVRALSSWSFFHWKKLVAFLSKSAPTLLHGTFVPTQWGLNGKGHTLMQKWFFLSEPIRTNAWEQGRWSCKPTSVVWHCAQTRMLRFNLKIRPKIPCSSFILNPAAQNAVHWASNNPLFCIDSWTIGPRHKGLAVNLSQGAGNVRWCESRWHQLQIEISSAHRSSTQIRFALKGNSIDIYDPINQHGSNHNTAAHTGDKILVSTKDNFVAVHAMVEIPPQIQMIARKSVFLVSCPMWEDVEKQTICPRWSLVCLNTVIESDLPSFLAPFYNSQKIGSWLIAQNFASDHRTFDWLVGRTANFRKKYPPESKKTICESLTVQTCKSAKLWMSVGKESLELQACTNTRCSAGCWFRSAQVHYQLKLFDTKGARYCMQQYFPYLSQWYLLIMISSHIGLRHSCIVLAYRTIERWSYWFLGTQAPGES